MQTDEMKKALDEKRFDDAIVLYVKKHQHVSFVELMRVLKDGGFQAEGNREIILGADKENAILWAGVSAEFCELIHELRRKQRIFGHPASELSYLADGAVLPLPIMRRPENPKQPHWLPVVFCSYPPAARA